MGTRTPYNALTFESFIQLEPFSVLARIDLLFLLLVRAIQLLQLFYSLDLSKY